MTDCPLCGAERTPDLERWDEETALEWVEDCIRWRGEVLRGDHAHWCMDWDALPVDETTDEYRTCSCFCENCAMGV